MTWACAEEAVLPWESVVVAAVVVVVGMVVVVVADVVVVEVDVIVVVVVVNLDVLVGVAARYTNYSAKNCDLATAGLTC